MSDEKLFTQADVNRFQAGFRKRLQARAAHLEQMVAIYEDRETMREHLRSRRSWPTRFFLWLLGVRA